MSLTKNSLLAAASAAMLFSAAPAFAQATNGNTTAAPTLPEAPETQGTTAVQGGNGATNGGATMGTAATAGGTAGTSTAAPILPEAPEGHGAAGQQGTTAATTN